MSLEVESYYNISEKQKYLAMLYEENKNAVFIVPSGLDKEPLLQLISGCGSFFGRRPDIWTWGELYSKTAPLDGEKIRRVIDPPDHMLIIQYILDIYLQEAENEGVDLPDGMKHRGFVSILGDNLRDLLAEEISPEHLYEAVLSDGYESLHAMPEAVLCRLYTDYIRYLDDNHIADNAQIPTLIKYALSGENAAAFTAGHTFIPVGFLSFTGGQIKLIRKLECLAKCILILPETGLVYFHDAIKQAGCDYSRSSDQPVNIAELHANNIHLQFDALARELALWGHGKSYFNNLGELKDYGNIGIQVKPDHRRIMENSLARYKIPFNAQVRGNVSETLPGELPKLLCEAYFSDWDTMSTVFLLSNPLIVCDDFNAQDCMSRFPSGYEAWRKILAGKARSRFERINLLCRALKEGGYPCVILKLWYDFLSELDIAKSAAVIAGDWASLDDVIKGLSSSLSELEKKIEILDDLNKDIGPAAKRRICGADSFNYIIDWSHTATLPITLPQSRSVALYEGMPPVLTSHRYWIMTDVDYNTWPGKLMESPLLCNDSKKKINVLHDAENADSPHIPEIHEEREQKEALFRRLIATGRDGVIISRSLTDMDGRPVGESQFVGPLLASADKGGHWKNIGKIEYPLSKSLPDKNDFWFPGAEVCLCTEKSDRGRFPKKGVIQTVDSPVVSLSAIDEWIACPYRYWCRTNLRMEKPLKDIFDSLKAGIFIHRLWEVSWKDYIENPRSFITICEKHWFGACSEKYPELTADPRLKRHYERLKKQVLSVADLLDKIESAPQVRLRTKIGLEFKLPVHEVDGIIFRGRCDRIDFYEKGAVVLDYKSNNASDHKNELQLAAYAAILKDKYGLEPYGYGWIGHGNGSLYGYFWDKDMIDAYHSPKAQKNLDELIQKAVQAMSDMAAAVKSGEFPAYYESDRCRYCEFYTVCRRKEALYCESDEASETEEDENDKY